MSPDKVLTRFFAKPWPRWQSKNTHQLYDERIGRDGTRFFEVKEIRLANTYAKLPGVTFQRGRDDPAEIQGILSVSATTL